MNDNNDNDKEIDIIDCKDYREGLVVRKSNEVIEGRNYNTIIENKVLDVCVAFAKKDKDGIYHASWDVKELEVFPGIDRHNISTTLNKMDKNSGMINKNYTISKSEGYTKFGLVDTFDYDKRKGHVECRFTHGASKYFNKMKDNYTPNLLAVTTRFTRVEIYRIYELCSVHAYKLYKYDKNEVRLKYNLYELKSKIDCNERFVILENELKEKFGREVSAKEVYDYAADNNIKLEKWKSNGEFKRSVLEKAKKEINTYSKIANNKRAFEFDYDDDRSGRGGKITDIILIVKKIPQLSYDSVDDSKVIPTDDGVDVIPISFSKEECLEVLKIFKQGHPVNMKEAERILVAADGDITRIKSVYNIARKTENIRNLIGFIIKGLEDGYDMVPSSPGYTYEETVEFQNYMNKHNLEEYGTDDPEEIDEIIKMQREEIARRYGTNDEIEISKIMVRERKERMEKELQHADDSFIDAIFKGEVPVDEVYFQEELFFGEDEEDSNNDRVIHDLSEEGEEIPLKPTEQEIDQEAKILEEIRKLEEQLKKVQQK